LTATQSGVSPDSGDAPDAHRQAATRPAARRPARRRRAPATQKARAKHADAPGPTRKRSRAKKGGPAKSAETERGKEREKQKPSEKQKKSGRPNGADRPATHDEHAETAPQTRRKREADRPTVGHKPTNSRFCIRPDLLDWPL